MILTPLEVAALKIEIDLIEKAINDSDGNKSEAAKLLQIDRKTLYNKINRFKEWQKHQDKNKSFKAKAPQ